MTTDWQSLPEGHYAIVDPHNPQIVTYWRRKDITTRKRGARPQFEPWPLKARNGPILWIKDIPRDLKGQARREWCDTWHANNSRPYKAAVIETIAADPIAAGKRFADLTSRCCACARRLTDDHSKVYGIGPECRSGISAEDLAEYFAPRLGHAHAEHLAEQNRRIP